MGDKKTTWFDHLPEAQQEGRAMITEEDFWEAVAEMTGLDYSEIADGDPVEWM